MKGNSGGWKRINSSGSSLFLERFLSLYLYYNSSILKVGDNVYDIVPQRQFTARPQGFTVQSSSKDSDTCTDLCMCLIGNRFLHGDFLGEGYRLSDVSSLTIQPVYISIST